LVGPKEIGHRQGARERIDLPSAIAAGVHPADDGAHAAAYDQIGADAEAVEHPEDTDVGQALRPTAGEDQRGAGWAAHLRGQRSDREESGKQQKQWKHATTK
jgi:hypothetical protein